MKDNPLVSILINNYNYGCFIGEAIDSALNQTYPHTEVIVVDDGSTDNSQEIIASYKDRIIPVLKENAGQASAFNVGFATSKGDIICFLDSDDTFVPEKVAKVVNAFCTNHEIDWCFHCMRLVDGNTGALLKINPENSSREWDLRSDIRRGKKWFFIPPATSGLCFTRSILQQIFPMPESEATTAADRYVKLIAMGLSKGFFINEQLTFQKIHGSNAYTGMSGKEQFHARETAVAAYWLKNKFPEFSKFTNKLFAKGLGIYWRTGGVEVRYKEVIKDYLSAVSLLERLEISLRAFYHRLRV